MTGSRKTAGAASYERPFTPTGGVETTLQDVLDKADRVSTTAQSVPSFSAASTAYIPTGTNNVLVEFYAPNVMVPATLIGGAKYKLVQSEPSHPLKFQNDGRWFEIDEDTPDVSMAGATEDGATDDYSAFASMTSLGKSFTVTKRGTRYRVTSPIQLASNQVMRGIGNPEIRIDSASSAILFKFDGCTDSAIEDIVMSVSASCPDTAVVTFASSFRCALRRCEGDGLRSDPLSGTVVISGSSFFNEISDNYFDNCQGTAIKLMGSSVSLNDILRNTLQNNGGFGIFLDTGVNKTTIRGNKTTASTLELIGIRYTCYENNVDGNFASGSGDNGISISGFNNTVTNNHCRGNEQEGIGIFGSGNTVTGNVCFDNGQDTSYDFAGIAIWPGFGGTGQKNVITGNTTGNSVGNTSQKNGIRINDNLFYPVWVTATAITAGAQRVNGLNIYQAATSGTTGATAPVHTTGTVSDGGVDWTWIAAFTGTATAAYNQIGPNTSVNEITDVFNMNGWGSDILISESLMRFPGKAVFDGGSSATWTSVNSLTVGKNNGNTGIAVWPGTGGIGRLAFGQASARAYLTYTVSTDALAIASGGADRVYLPASGRVGINKAAPDYQFDVNGAIGFAPGASVTPANNGDVVFQLTSNTQLTVKAKGSDGVVRSGNITLA